jgi:hypothetical protein
MHKIVSEAELKGLSRLQKALLKKGLEAHCVGALDHVYGIEPEGSFGIKTMMKSFEDPKERARRRAAAGRSIERLIGRRLLESCSRGSWRLTRGGLEAARKLYPEMRELSARELERHDALRELIDSWIRERPQVTKRRHKPRQKIEAEKGLEVDFDF